MPGALLLFFGAFEARATEIDVGGTARARYFRLLGIKFLWEGFISAVYWGV